MPYEMRKVQGKYCVFNKQTGDNKGCSDTKNMALGHMRALYAAESAGSKDFMGSVWEYQVPQDLAQYNPLGGTNEKACANCQYFDSPNGCLVVQGDISPTGLSALWHEQMTYSGEMPTIPVSVENWDEMPGLKEVWTTAYIDGLPDSAFAYVEPGCKTKSCRHFPYKDSSGKIDLPHLRNALARAPQSPFGDKALPTLRAAAKRVGVGQKSFVDEKIDWITNKLFSPDGRSIGFSPVRLTKDLDGSTRAHIVFSNNFQDRHDQIIPEVVHNTTIDWIERTQIYPEFQIWHMGSKTRWGKADSIVRIGNFTVASGPVDPGMEPLAEAFASNPELAVSHGYYAAYTPDKKEFAAWYPFEISPLPATAAANIWMADDYILESEGFLMTPEQKALLKAKGVSEEFIVGLETDLEARSKQVSNAGIASKEVEPDIATALATVLDAKLTPLVNRLTALETGQKSLEDKTKDIDSAIIAKIAGLPQGFKATETETNTTDDLGALNDPNVKWLGDELDKILHTAGVQ